MKSILQKDNTYCYYCGRNGNGDPLEKHHIFRGINRKKSEEEIYAYKVGYNEAIDNIMRFATTADVEIKKDGEWEMFDLISSAYYGKGMYFKQDDGTVYSRYSCKYMSVDEAIREFVSLIDGNGSW